MSSVAKTRCEASVSAVRPSPISVSIARSIRRLASRTATGPRWAISSPMAVARATAWPAATTSLTRPMRSASAAVSTLPVRISSLARAGPTIRGSRCVPPAPGVTASRTSGSPILARSEATRRSQHRAISRPPPRALPSIAAMVGIGRAASRAPTRDSSSCRARPPGPRCASNSPTWDPAENARSPSPVTTTARTSPGRRPRASPARLRTMRAGSRSRG